MQSKRAIFMLLLSLVAGAAAVVLGARWLGQQASGDRTQVLVATRDLDLGQGITAEMLQPVAWPTDNVPSGAFTDPKLLEGRVVRNSMFKGEPVLEPKLAPVGTKAGLDSIIKPGHRAISVKVNEVVGVAGFLAPGSFVDLLVNIRDDREAAAVSRVVLERIMVLAVAQEARRPDENKPKVVNAVTLEVTPDQAEKIDLARNVGTLSLMLRNQVDTKDDVNTAGVRREDLFGDAKPAPAPVVTAAPVRRVVVRRPAPAAMPAAPPALPAATVEVIRGTQKSSASF